MAVGEMTIEQYREYTKAKKSIKPKQPEKCRGCI
jgi:hypothetical protein